MHTNQHSRLFRAKIDHLTTKSGPNTSFANPTNRRKVELAAAPDRNRWCDIGGVILASERHLHVISREFDAKIALLWERSPFSSVRLNLHQFPLTVPAAVAVSHQTNCENIF
ncbi:hypothetical protein Zmor_024228 [Zophobas morio]|uniref:Uncharacterized protein n=1 Tax=Zophobas morio TaxID=2755281 RepID=A0AA38I0G2_9CUCU|nr:hypothetical protein Zmor_024228 [Zophobas morio]